MSRQYIHLKGVSTHNLKNIDVDIPLGQLTVVTGVSGSGKSSLVFDTLYAESYRRYVQSFSSFARQYLQSIPKPQMESVQNLPCAIAVKQTRSGSSARSTVGTMTEATDYLRLIFTHLAELKCPQCDIPITAHETQQLRQFILKECAAKRWQFPITILAPLAGFSTISGKELITYLLQQGFVRLLTAENKIQKLEDIKHFKSIKEGFLIIDRIDFDADLGDDAVERDQRMHIAIVTAYKLGKARIRIISGDLPTPSKPAKIDQVFYQTRTCSSCERHFRKPTVALFSFNHPVGACTRCQGFGKEAQLNLGKAVSSLNDSLADAASIKFLDFGPLKKVYALIHASAKAKKISLQKPFNEWTKSEWSWLRQGDTERKYAIFSFRDFHGLDAYFHLLESFKGKMHYRIHAARYRSYVECTACNGKRLNPDALSYRWLGQDISDLQTRTSQELLESFQSLPAFESQDQNTIDALSESFSELSRRLEYLCRVGLSYLTLDRSLRTLSGGEQQRVQMTRCLGGALTETLYCLDEPTVGLHARDTEKIVALIKELRDQGNTVVCVEHEGGLIRAADHLIEIGPRAGYYGGEISYQGACDTSRLKSFTVDPSIVAKAAKAEKRMPKLWQSFDDIRTFNLKIDKLRLPLEGLTVICGVSGSGKTSLVLKTIYPALLEAMNLSTDVDQGPLQMAKIKPSPELKKFKGLYHVSQEPLARSSRSCLGTYLGFFEDIRRHFAATESAKAKGLTPGYFSFNSPGGRCEECKGMGRITEDLSFLGEMEVMCPECEGRRFTAEALSHKWKGLSVLDVLNLTIEEARQIFWDDMSVYPVLQKIIDVGLGYLTVGQNSSSFSGGEAQRVKLLKVLSDAKFKAGDRCLFIFDEPTSGLSHTDTAQLLDRLKALVQQGHGVWIIEHHIEVIRQADWVVEIGPEAGDAGGEIVYEGTPQGLDTQSAPRSQTAPYMIQERLPKTKKNRERDINESLT